MSEIFKNDMNEMSKWELPKQHSIENVFDNDNPFEDCYKSPIEMIVSQMSSEFDRMADKQLMLRVNQAVDFYVDKAELLKALQYDRNQYDKGYADAKKKYQRPKGKWDESGNCSKCGMDCSYHLSGTIWIEESANYCPHCGADMREVEE